MSDNKFIQENLSVFKQGAMAYSDFTSDLINSTFDAIVTSNIKQMESYTEMVGLLTKGLSHYINETKMETNGEEVLNYLELLPLDKVFEKEVSALEFDNKGELIALGANEEKINLKGNEKPAQSIIGAVFGSGLTGAASTVATTALKEVSEKINISDSVHDGASNLIGSLFKNDGNLNNTEVNKLPNNLKTGTGTSTKPNYSELLFEAISEKISANKYTLLQNMVETGLLRMIIDSGYIKTGLEIEFYQYNKDKFQELDKEKDKSRNKAKTKQKNGFNFFLFRKRRKHKTKTVETHFEVHKTKVNNTEINKGKMNMNAEVMLHFSTDYKPLINR